MSENKALDVNKEAEAVRFLMDAFKNEDDETRDIVIESETNFKEAVAMLLRQMDDDKALVAGIKDRLEELGSRKSRIERRVERTRSSIEAALMIAECGPIEAPCGTVSIKKGQPQLRITDEAAVPAKYWVRGDPKLDKKTLLKDLKAWPDECAKASAAGEELPPPIAGATLSNAPDVLQIRVK